MTVAIVALTTFAAGRASALQPLAVFVATAHDANLDTQAARATVVQRRRDADQAWARLGPSITARGAYTRNQYEAIVSIPAYGNTPARSATFMPYDQWDASVTADLPLVDLGAWHRIAAANSNLESARAQLLASSEDTKRAVAQSYVRVVAGEAVLSSSKKQVDAAAANLAVVESRQNAGSASDLDVERARADAARTQQDVADAINTVTTSRNALQSLTGLLPSPGAPSLDDDLRPESPVEEFYEGLTAIGSVRAAHADSAAAQRSERASYAALLPTLNATASEHATNAPGFGTSPYWTAGGYVQVKLDLFTYEGARSLSESVDLAKIREAKARQDARDAVFNAWHQVAASIAKAAAARAQAQASAHATEIARTRYAVGTATQLEVIDAARDAFTADVARIQADADLVYARIALRVAAGKPLEIGGRS